MRHLLLLAIGVLLLTSCSQEIEDNTPAFQGVRDSIFFRGFSNSAVVNPNGSIAVRGANNLEEVRILVSAINQTNVVLGEGAAPGNSATYTNEFGTIFSTNNDSGSGEVSLQINGDNTVSGTFNFVALTENETDTVTFSRGFIFEVPFLGELNTDDGPTQEPDSFTARVNTVIYTPTEINSSVSSGVLQISANRGDGTAISLTMPENATPGTFDITADGLFTALYVDADGVNNASTGSLTIISNNTTERRITGDFVFDTAGGFLITDGGFSISY